VSDSERVAAKPQLRSPEPARPERKPGEIALELRRFHATPPDVSENDLGFRSAALAAVEAVPLEIGEELGPDEVDALAGGGIPQYLQIAARKRLVPRRDGFLVEIRGLAQRVRDRLTTEQEKDEGRKPGRLEQAMTPGAAGHIDFSVLSDVMGEDRGTIRLQPQEEARARAALAVLESFEFPADEPLVRIVHDGLREPAGLPGVTSETAPDPASAALEIFDREAVRLIDVVRATRIARLVLDNALDEETHGPWLDRFGLNAFRPDELLLVTVVVALEAVDVLEDQGLRSFSRLLLSRRPVHLMVTGSPRHLFQEGLEPAYLAMGHRKAFAQQSSPGHGSHFFAGLLASLDHARPALHMLDESSGPADAEVAARALASRAHPYFRYDPAAGSSWAGRLDFSGHPAAESVWPTVSLEIEHADGSPETMELSVTYGDFLLDRVAGQAHVRPVPAGCPEDALSPLADWLELDGDDALLRVPWLWAIDAAGELQRVVVTRRLARICRERADYWHTLQELAGVRNEYVTEAVQRARSEDEEAAAAERERLRTEHAERLDAAKRKAVEEAMSHLARRLLDLDPGALPVAGDAAPAAAEAPEPAPAATPPSEPAPAAAKDEELELGEPWIDTPLCTSCNDCTAINPHLFVYDGNKQALIGNIQMGTFAQVVQAAEKCPARCIHPGAPWNGDESGLDGLIERAKPFQ
jgi:ferredoxin